MERRTVLSGVIVVVATSLIPGAAVVESIVRDTRPWKVFCINDCDWWVARSLDEAVRDYREQCGLTDADREMWEEAYEVGDEWLDRLRFHRTDDEDRSYGTVSFREELRDRIADGLEAPEMFASTEY